MNDHFTANEVMAMLEEIRGEFRAVLDVVAPLREDVSTLKEDMVEIKDRLFRVENEVRGIKDALRLELPLINRRLSVLENKVGINN